jgi:hypothetical protein
MERLSSMDDAQTRAGNGLKYFYIDAHLPTLSLEFSCVASSESARDGFYQLSELKAYSYGLERYIEPTYSEMQVIEAYIDAYIQNSNSNEME